MKMQEIFHDDAEIENASVLNDRREALDYRIKNLTNKLHHFVETKEIEIETDVNKDAPPDDTTALYVSGANLTYPMHVTYLKDDHRDHITTLIRRINQTYALIQELLKKKRAI